MTELLKRAIERVQALPPGMQDELAREILQMAGEEQPVHFLTAEEKGSLSSSLAEAGRGEFASDDEVRAVWAEHGL
tara:strand:+ start:460 stop:687 length:228 start_codon:yes stop_codon:yes gene_type:complete